MSDVFIALAIVIVALAILDLCICYLLRQIARALNYQNMEITHQVILLRKIATHTEVSRLYLQHISRRTRALQEVKHDEGVLRTPGVRDEEQGADPPGQHHFS